MVLLIIRFALVARLRGKGIHTVCCSDGCSAAVSSDGKLYSWGSGTSGQLGHGHHFHQHQPKLVNFFHDAAINIVQPKLVNLFHVAAINIVQVSCGPYHTAAISTTGALYTWGNGLFGKLGHGDHSSSYSPRKVAALDAYEVQRVDCGWWHTAAVAVPRGEAKHESAANSVMDLDPDVSHSVASSVQFSPPSYTQAPHYLRNRAAIQSSNLPSVSKTVSLYPPGNGVHSALKTPTFQPHRVLSLPVSDSVVSRSAPGLDSLKSPRLPPCAVHTHHSIDGGVPPSHAFSGLPLDSTLARTSAPNPSRSLGDMTGANAIMSSSVDSNVLPQTPGNYTPIARTSAPYPSRSLGDMTGANAIMSSSADSNVLPQTPAPTVVARGMLFTWGGDLGWQEPGDIRGAAQATASGNADKAASLSSKVDHHHGCLGTGDKAGRLLPTRVRGVLERRDVAMVACGWNLTVALTHEGHVFQMGATGAYNPEEKKEVPWEGCLHPTQVDGNLFGMFIEEVSCGMHHVAVVASKLGGNGKLPGETRRCGLLTWGRGSHGQLGISTKGNSPKDFNLPQRCGLLTWGRGFHGQLGISTKGNSPKDFNLPQKKNTHSSFNGPAWYPTTAAMGMVGAAGSYITKGWQGPPAAVPVAPNTNFPVARPNAHGPVYIGVNPNSPSMASPATSSHPSGPNSPAPPQPSSLLTSVWTKFTGLSNLRLSLNPRNSLNGAASPANGNLSTVVSEDATDGTCRTGRRTSLNSDIGTPIKTKQRTPRLTRSLSVGNSDPVLSPSRLCDGSNVELDDTEALSALERDLGEEESIMSGTNVEGGEEGDEESSESDVSEVDSQTAMDNSASYAVGQTAATDEVHELPPFSTWALHSYSVSDTASNGPYSKSELAGNGPYSKSELAGNRPHSKSELAGNGLYSKSELAGTGHPASPVAPPRGFSLGGVNQGPGRLISLQQISAGGVERRRGESMGGAMDFGRIQDFSSPPAPENWEPEAWHSPLQPTSSVPRTSKRPISHRRTNSMPWSGPSDSTHWDPEAWHSPLQPTSSVPRTRKRPISHRRTNSMPWSGSSDSTQYSTHTRHPGAGGGTTSEVGLTQGPGLGGARGLPGINGGRGGEDAPLAWHQGSSGMQQPMFGQQDNTSGEEEQVGSEGGSHHLGGGGASHVDGGIPHHHAWGEEQRQLQQQQQVLAGEDERLVEEDMITLSRLPLAVIRESGSPQASPRDETAADGASKVALAVVIRESGSPQASPRDEAAAIAGALDLGGIGSTVRLCSSIATAVLNLAAATKLNKIACTTLSERVQNLAQLLGHLDDQLSSVMKVKGVFSNAMQSIQDWSRPRVGMGKIQLLVASTSVMESMRTLRNEIGEAMRDLTDAMGVANCGDQNGTHGVRMATLQTAKQQDDELLAKMEDVIGEEAEARCKDVAHFGNLLMDVKQLILDGFIDLEEATILCRNNQLLALDDLHQLGPHVFNAFHAKLEGRGMLLEEASLSVSDHMLGCRGNSQVWAATLAGQPVAFKQVKLVSDDENVRMEMQGDIEREANMLLLLQGPGIVEFKGVVMGKNMGLVYKRYTGSLDSVLILASSSRSPLSYSDRLDMGVQVVQGLLRMHSHGLRPLVHGDLKPGNVLTENHPGGGRTCVISDLGIANFQRTTSIMPHASPSKGHTQTVRYTAPEVLINHHRTRRPPSDIYSLGALLAELVTGCRPFMHASNDDEVRRLTVLGQSPYSLNASVMYPSMLIPSENLLACLRLCWSMEPSLRPNAAEVLRVLKAEQALQSPVHQQQQPISVSPPITASLSCRPQGSYAAASISGQAPQAGRRKSHLLDIGEGEIGMVHIVPKSLGGARSMEVGRYGDAHSPCVGFPSLHARDSMVGRYGDANSPSVGDPTSPAGASMIEMDSNTSSLYATPSPGPLYETSSPGPGDQGHLPSNLARLAAENTSLQQQVAMLQRQLMETLALQQQSQPHPQHPNLHHGQSQPLPHSAGKSSLGVGLTPRAGEPSSSSTSPFSNGGAGPSGSVGSRGGGDYSSATQPQMAAANQRQVGQIPRMLPFFYGGTPGVGGAPSGQAGGGGAAPLTPRGGSSPVTGIGRMTPASVQSKVAIPHPHSISKNQSFSADATPRSPPMGMGSGGSPGNLNVGGGGGGVQVAGMPQVCPPKSKASRHRRAFSMDTTRVHPVHFSQMNIPPQQLTSLAAWQPSMAKACPPPPLKRGSAGIPTPDSGSSVASYSLGSIAGVGHLLRHFNGESGALEVGPKEGLGHRTYGGYAQAAVEHRARQEQEFVGAESWEEEVHMGVHFWLHRHPSGKPELVKIRFSKQHFNGSEAEKWWKSNAGWIYEKYVVNIEVTQMETRPSQQWQANIDSQSHPLLHPHGIPPPALDPDFHLFKLGGHGRIPMAPAPLPPRAPLYLGSGASIPPSLHRPSSQGSIHAGSDTYGSDPDHELGSWVPLPASAANPEIDLHQLLLQQQQQRRRRLGHYRSASGG
eukprot:gene11987-15081_t